MQRLRRCSFDPWVRKGWEGPLKKEMAAHTSILGWRIPWTEEPGGLQSMGLKKVRTEQEQPSNGSYGWTFAIDSLTGDTVFEPQLSKMLFPTKMISFFSLVLMDLDYKNIYPTWWLEFHQSNWGNADFLPCYISSHIISSVLPLGPKSLKYLLSGSSQKIFAAPWSSRCCGSGDDFEDRCSKLVN